MFTESSELKMLRELKIRVMICSLLLWQVAQLNYNSVVVVVVRKLCTYECTGVAKRP